MEPAPHPASRRRLGTPPAQTAELVLQAGRLNGTRRPLHNPLTLIGRAESCDIRLDADGVAPLHCVLAAGPSGVGVRDLQSATGTLVNSQRVTARVLHDGDVLAVGPFQFKVRLPATGTAPSPSASAETNTTGAPAHDRAEPGTAEKEALRIQAAAVAAQQAALTEEEARLQQRRAALEQQEGQLAAHLEAKRQRLVRLREEAQAARAAVQKERSRRAAT